MNNTFNISDFNKIEDIIFFDEPILSHYKKENKDYLLYLIENLDNSDLFLLLDTNENSIVKYLNGDISLLELIKSNKNYCFYIEQDFDDQNLDFVISETKYISKEHLPSDKSFLNYIPLESSYYYNLIEKYKQEKYLRGLRDSAFYVKFTAKEKKYHNTFSLSELSDSLLKNLKGSFNDFAKIDFKHNFESKFTEEKDYRSAYKSAFPKAELRAVDFAFSSFEIGFAVDNIMNSNVEDLEIRKWTKSVGYKFKEIALNECYSEEKITEINKEYNDDERKKIFNPILKITENPNFDFSIKNTSQSSYNRINHITNKFREKVLPIIKIEVETKLEDIEIVNVLAVINKNNKTTTIKLNENTLFNSLDNNSYQLTNKDFEKSGYLLEENINIDLSISTKSGLLIVKCEYELNKFEIIEESKNINESISRIVDKIYQYIINKNI